MTNKLIIANWKMNPQTHAEAERLVAGVSGAATRSKKETVVLCIPFPWLTDISHKAHGRTCFGAQDVFWEERGAYTGEVSPLMLKNSGVQYVIIGHSDRRRLLGETDEMVNKKVLAALAAGLKVVLCVGDAKRELKMKDKGLSKAKKYIQNQLKKDLRNISNFKLQTSNLIVCYEPVWAISTARSKTSRDNADTPEAAGKMITFMKHFLNSQFSILNPRVIYGGSVNPKNARAFLSRKEIDGALVGAASLNAKDFVKVIEAANG